MESIYVPLITYTCSYFVISRLLFG